MKTPHLDGLEYFQNSIVNMMALAEATTQKVKAETTLADRAMIVAKRVSATHYRQLPFGKLDERDFIRALATAAMDAAAEPGRNVDPWLSGRMRLAARNRAIEIAIGLHRRTEEPLPGVVPRVRIPKPLPVKRYDPFELVPLGRR